MLLSASLSVKVVIRTPLMDPLQLLNNGYPDLAATEAAGALTGMRCRATVRRAAYA